MLHQPSPSGSAYRPGSRSVFVGCSVGGGDAYAGSMEDLAENYAGVPLELPGVAYRITHAKVPPLGPIRYGFSLLSHEVIFCSSLSRQAGTICVHKKMDFSHLRFNSDAESVFLVSTSDKRVHIIVESKRCNS